MSHRLDHSTYEFPLRIKEVWKEIPEKERQRDLRTARKKVSAFLQNPEEDKSLTRLYYPLREIEGMEDEGEIKEEALRRYFSLENVFPYLLTSFTSLPEENFLKKRKDLVKHLSQMISRNHLTSIHNFMENTRFYPNYRYFLHFLLEDILNSGFLKVYETPHLVTYILEQNSQYINEIASFTAKRQKQQGNLQPNHRHEPFVTLFGILFWMKSKEEFHESIEYGVNYLINHSARFYETIDRAKTKLKEGKLEDLEKITGVYNLFFFLPLLFYITEHYPRVKNSFPPHQVLDRLLKFFILFLQKVEEETVTYEYLTKEGNWREGGLEGKDARSEILVTMLSSIFFTEMYYPDELSRGNVKKIANILRRILSLVQNLPSFKPPYYSMVLFLACEDSGILSLLKDIGISQRIQTLLAERKTEFITSTEPTPLGEDEERYIIDIGNAKRKIEEIISSSKERIWISTQVIKSFRIQQFLIEKKKELPDIDIRVFVRKKFWEQKERGKFTRFGDIISSLREKDVSVNVVPHLHARAILSDSNYAFISSIDMTETQISTNLNLGILTSEVHIIEKLENWFRLLSEKY